jgi:hypothetical protein
MGKRNIPKLLGIKLKTVRTYNGLSQEQMCEIVGALNRAGFPNTKQVKVCLQPQYLSVI